MDFKKKFDYNDINNYLPDNFTLGNALYYENKYNHKLPEGLSQILEAQTRAEYTEEDTTNIIQNVIQQQINYGEQLIREYNERCIEQKEELPEKPMLQRQNGLILSNNNIEEVNVAEQ